MSCMQPKENSTKQNIKKMEKKINITKEDEQRLIETIRRELNKKPPTIGLIGVSGVGKSSTINAMFKTNLAVSHVVACTKEFESKDLEMTMKQGAGKGQRIQLRVIDAPGLGEDIKFDPNYLKMYRDNLPECDVILWVITARNRAIALDQLYLKELSEFTDRMVFGINQIDLIEPRDWNNELNLPSVEQENNLEIITKDRKEKLEDIIDRQISIIPYSANSKYQLQELFTALIEACPKERSWIFSALKGFTPEDFLPESLKDDIVELYEKRKNPEQKKKRGWFN